MTGNEMVKPMTQTAYESAVQQCIEKDLATLRNGRPMTNAEMVGHAAFYLGLIRFTERTDSERLDERNIASGRLRRRLDDVSRSAEFVVAALLEHGAALKLDNQKGEN